MADNRNAPCSDGCTCGKHAGRSRRKCPFGCSCSRHTKSGGPRLTEEQRQVSLERRRENNRQYMRDNRERYAENQRERNRIHGRRYFLKYKFGLTIEQWDSMLIGQLGCCYLCERPMMGRIDIDHDHSCCPGKKSCGQCIRGLACQNCNQGIGQFGDDFELILRVAGNLAKKTLASREQSQ